MPVQQGPNTSPLSFYWDLPPVTRVLLTAFAAVRGIQALGFPIPMMMYLSWSQIFSRWQVALRLTHNLSIKKKGQATQNWEGRIQTNLSQAAASEHCSVTLAGLKLPAAVADMAIGDSFFLHPRQGLRGANTVPLDVSHSPAP